MDKSHLNLIGSKLTISKETWMMSTHKKGVWKKLYDPPLDYKCQLTSRYTNGLGNCAQRQHQPNPRRGYIWFRSLQKALVNWYFPRGKKYSKRVESMPLVTSARRDRSKKRVGVRTAARGYSRFSPDFFFFFSSPHNDERSKQLFVGKKKDEGY